MRNKKSLKCCIRIRKDLTVERYQETSKMEHWQYYYYISVKYQGLYWVDNRPYYLVINKEKLPDTINTRKLKIVGWNMVSHVHSGLEKVCNINGNFFCKSVEILGLTKCLVDKTFCKAFTSAWKPEEAIYTFLSSATN